MRSARPPFSLSDAELIVAQRFGLRVRARELPAELDRNFLLEGDDQRRFVLKISPPDTGEQTLACQVAVLQRLAGSELAPIVPLVHPATDGRRLLPLPGPDGATYRARMLGYLEGTPLARLDHHPPHLLREVGATLACLDRLLLDFDHPGARRPIPWDLTRTLELEESLPLLDGERRLVVAAGLGRFRTMVLPRLGQLRRSVIHNDANDHNILVAEESPGRFRLSGLIDFGDLVHTVTVAEPAIAAAYLMLGRDEPWRAAAHIVAGYHQRLPLLPSEQELLPYLIEARLCASLLMSGRARNREPDNAYLQVSEAGAWSTLERLAMSDPDSLSTAVATIADACSEPVVTVRSADEIIAVRRRHLGRNLSISYRQPLKIVRGEGQYLFDHQGRRYLDLVNNVCHVGHCHPRVVAAAQRQMALLNTNTRYLHDNLAEYALRLTSLMPAPLEICFFVCTGTEANDLALRLARAHTGSREIIVLDHAYHGHSPSLIEISPYKCEGPGGEGLAPHAHKVRMPDPYRGPHRGPSAGQRYADEVARVVASIAGSGRRLGAFMAESLIGCGGQIVLPEGYLQSAYQAVREAGGVCIADEVQVGFGRVGSHRWGFEIQGVVPDIVTLGKPIGNGHPLAAVVTTPDIASSFDTGMEYFNTFGGNPVSCAVGLAVLQVIEDEQLQAHAFEVGRALLDGLRQLQQHHALIGDVRGRGLFIGVELVRDRDSQEPAGDEAAQVIEGMRERGFLLSTDGPFHNVLKIKPPLVLQHRDGEQMLAALDQVLAAHSLKVAP